MLKRDVKRQLEAKLNELQMNLANNYKDLAHDALKELDALVDDLYAQGRMKEKDYIMQRTIVDDYKKRMASYHH